MPWILGWEPVCGHFVPAEMVFPAYPGVRQFWIALTSASGWDTMVMNQTTLPRSEQKVSQ
jgi:hypothetical protein